MCKYLKLYRKRKLYIDIFKRNFYNKERVKTIVETQQQ